MTHLNILNILHFVLNLFLKKLKLGLLAPF